MPLPSLSLPSLPPNASLADSSRLRAVAGRLGASPWAETSVLAFLGVSAAMLTLEVDLDLHIPGHAILRCIVPIALGLALVPRKFAGTVMGGAALATVLAHGAGAAPGWGSATSLVLTGPILDLAARRARTGRSVYVALIAGGAVSNVLAFAVRLVAKVLTPGGGGGPLATWWPRASGTYLLCGVAAGLVSAVLWFRFGARGAEPERVRPDAL